MRRVSNCGVSAATLCYRISGGEEQGREPAARAVGTTIRVQDLFYNTPARMKFLKKDSSEGTFVADNVGHVALSHPEVSVAQAKSSKVELEAWMKQNLFDK